MQYQYHTESVFLEEKMFLRTGAHSTEAINALSSRFNQLSAEGWELFHIESDRSQCHDLAAEQPDKLEELKALWFSEADKYNGLPLADLTILETMTRWRPYLAGARYTYTYYPNTAEVGLGAAA